MKKFWLAMLSVMAVLLFAGCNNGGDNLETKTFVKEEPGVTLKMTYYHDGDKVVKQTADNIIEYSALGVADAEAAKSILEPIAQSYRDLEGVEYEIVYEESRALENLTVYFDDLDEEAAKQVLGITIEGDTSNGISMKRSEEMLLNDGYELQ